MLSAINAIVVAFMIAALIMLMMSFTGPSDIYSVMYLAVVDSISAKSCVTFIIVCMVLLGLIRFIRHQFQPQGQRSWPNHP